MNKNDKILCLLGLLVFLVCVIVYMVLDKLDLVSISNSYWYETLLSFFTYLAEAILLIEWGKYLQRKENRPKSNIEKLIDEESRKEIK